MREDRLAAAVDLLLDDVVRSGQEIGVQVAVIRSITHSSTQHAVHPTRIAGAPVDRDTLFWSGSTAKGVASSVAHVLIECGEITDD